MSHAKRQNKMEHAKIEKKKPVKPDDDCSCTSSDNDTTSDCSSKDQNKEQKYDECCTVDVTKGKTCCRRKCRTICVIECSKPVTYEYNWTRKTKKDDNWKPCESEPIPKKCDDKKY